MRPFALTAALAALLGLADALTAYYTVEYWKDSQYSGDHVVRTVPVGSCADLPGGWNDAVSSAKIYAGCRCYFYKNAGCQDVAPADLKVTLLGPQSVPDFVKVNFNDVASSIRCEAYSSAVCSVADPPPECQTQCITYA